MAINPLGVTQSGMDIPGMNSQPYPTLSPAQGGVGPGSAGAPPPGQEGGDGSGEKVDNVAALARLMSIMGISPDNPQDSAKIQGFLMGMGLPSAKRIADQKLPRGITDDPMSGPSADQQKPPMPPGLGSTPMPPGPMS